MLALAERPIREWGMSATEGFPGPRIERSTKKLWHIEGIHDWLEQRRAV